MVKMGARGLFQFHFDICRVITRIGGSTVPLYLQYVFLWTLGSYSIPSNRLVSTFKLLFYYVIISVWQNKNYQSKQKLQKLNVT